ncbi:MAG: DUF3267 domain-containing protein [Chloroflexota bacterium]
MQQSIFAENERSDLSVPLAETAVSTLLIGLLPTLPFIIAFGVLWQWQAALLGFGHFFGTIGLFWLAVLGGIVAHELLHGLTWMVAGRKSLRTMTYGVQWKTLTPYAHSSEPLPAWAYRLGVLMPALVLGFAPMLAGLAIANGWLFFFGVIFTIAAGGDFLVLWLLRGVNGRSLVADHPENAGCFVYAE